MSETHENDDPRAQLLTDTVIRLTTAGRRLRKKGLQENEIVECFISSTTLIIEAAGGDAARVFRQAASLIDAECGPSLRELASQVGELS